MAKKYKLEEVGEVIGGHMLERLAEVIKLSYIPDWFSKKNKGFDNKTPYTYCKNHGCARLDRKISHLESGLLS